MKKAYLLVYSDLFGSREEVKDYLNSMQDVDTWRYDLPNCFYLISEESAETLADQLIELSEGKGRFIVSETTDNRQGLLSQETWFLIENKSKFRKTRKD